MQKAALFCALLGLLACRPPGTVKVPPGPVPVAKTIQRRDVSGGEVFNVTLRATPKLPPGMVDLLEKEFSIRRVDPHDRKELAFWRDRPMALDSNRAEAQLEIMPANSSVKSDDYIWIWPESFRISRPGVIEPRPGLEGVRADSSQAATLIRPVAQASAGSPVRVKGKLWCGGDPLPYVGLTIGQQSSVPSALPRLGYAKDDGTFDFMANLPPGPYRIFIGYDGAVLFASSTTAGGSILSVPLRIVDETHTPRGEHVDRGTIIESGVADFNSIVVPGDDCKLWRLGVEALTAFFNATAKAPPAGGLTIVRWSAVFTSERSVPFTFYDAIVTPTDWPSLSDPEWTLFHEFGHSIRHVADGSATHWHWDDFRFFYGHYHDINAVWNKGFAFNEGWGNYWATAVLRPGYSVTLGPDFLDWNEGLIGNYLVDMGNLVGPKFMVDVLLSNPYNIHTLRQFEERYCAAVSGPNTFCNSGRPARPEPTACPPGYSEDWLTCRLNNILPKPSFGRGVGTLPKACGPGQDYDAGLCYPSCPAGFNGVGPVCWQVCPAGYSDDGATCRKNAQIIGADNNACPWYDKCGLTFARGCSSCPAGFHNDGCTCRIDVDIFGKSTQTRGVGSVPSSCQAGLQYDAGLCYQPCPSGFNGIGPVCWGSCPAGFDDNGATCYRAPSIIWKDQ